MAPKKLLLSLAFSLLIPSLLSGQSKTDMDTTYFALQTKMIEKAKIHKIELKKRDYYQVYVQLKDEYREQYKQATARGIDTFFAITYHGDILSSRLPVLRQKITTGRFTIEPFYSRNQAQKVMRRILGKD